MGCDEFREALSARLDGEDDPAERAVTDAHLAGCAACRQWFDAAAQVTRMVRTSVVTHEVKVSDAVLAAAPGRRRARLLGAVRVALGALGVVQFLLGRPRSAGSRRDGTCTRSAWARTTCGTSRPPGTSRSAPASPGSRSAAARARG
ncbi:hypothetical protein Pflav_037880 [Phytohabitans flavus]|uniref:Putative zinc-finger domain-containing protein n=1 Tax=Phytohabitans flavus TaxID=1076124 RepID=A0A6F8XUG2_9ACTN|nr:hypothetical protein Pflav_037880 [Phytohabitans flavus]